MNHINVNLIHYIFDHSVAFSKDFSPPSRLFPSTQLFVNMLRQRPPKSLGVRIFGLTSLRNVLVTICLTFITIIPMLVQDTNIPVFCQTCNQN